MYKITVKKKVLKSISKMPVEIQEKLSLLIDDLREKGAVQHRWPNYSKLNDCQFHCHLGYKWVACWKVGNMKKIQLLLRYTMQVHVKMPHIKIDIKGVIDPQIIYLLKKLYGKNLKLIKDTEDELVDIFETDWYRGIKSGMTPGKNMKIYRENFHLTQKELGMKLGGISSQNISHMERGVRAISKKNSILLSQIFNVPVERFL